MTLAIRALLFALMLLLCAGFIAIVSAMVREARLDAGETPGTPPAAAAASPAGIAACVAVAAVFSRQLVVDGGGVELLAIRLQAAAGARRR